jgi:hypothetical protein
MPSETYGKTTREVVANKLRNGKIERLEYFGRSTANTATEIFIDGKGSQANRLYIPLNTVIYVEAFGTARDSAGTPVNDAFRGLFRIHRNASGVPVVTNGTNQFVSAADGTTAYAKLVAAVSGTDEVRFTYTGAAASGLNVIRFRLNVVSVSTDADTLAM